MTPVQRSNGYSHGVLVLAFLNAVILLLGARTDPPWSFAAIPASFLVLVAAVVLLARNRRFNWPEPPPAEKYRLAAALQAVFGLLILIVGISTGALEGRPFALFKVVLAGAMFIVALVFYLLSRRAERAR